MKALSVPRSLYFYESAMKQLAGQQQYDLALSVYEHVSADNLQPSAVTYSCLIDFAAKVGEFQKAIRFFEMVCETSVPSIRAHMAVLRVYSKLQDWTASVNLL